MPSLKMTSRPSTPQPVQTTAGGIHDAWIGESFDISFANKGVTLDRIRSIARNGTSLAHPTVEGKNAI